MNATHASSNQRMINSTVRLDHRFTFPASASLLSTCWLTAIADVPVVPFLILPILLTVSCVTDLADRRIPNWLTYTAIAIALAASAVVSWQQQQGLPTAVGSLNLSQALSGFAALFGLMLVVYVTLGIGAGDVKLAGAIGACLGVDAGLQMLLWTHLVAGVFAGLLIISKIGPARFLAGLLSHLFPGRFLMPPDGQTPDLQAPIPMAIFFAIGTFLSLLEIPLI